MKPKAFIISLARVPERREHAIREAEKAGLDWEIVEALDAREFRMEDGSTDWDALSKVQIWNNHNWGCQFKASEICIYASHLRAYQRMLNLDIPRALILEDDFRLLDAPYTIQDVMHDMEYSPGGNHVTLHHEHLHFNSAYRVLGPWKNCRTLNRVRQAPLIAVASVITRRFASLFISEQSLMVSPFDHAICRMSADENQTFLQTSFAVCGSAGFSSTQG